MTGNQKKEDRRPGGLFFRSLSLEGEVVGLSGKLLPKFVEGEVPYSSGG